MYERVNKLLLLLICMNAKALVPNSIVQRHSQNFTCSLNLHACMVTVLNDRTPYVVIVQHGSISHNV